MAVAWPGGVVVTAHDLRRGGLGGPFPLYDLAGASSLNVGRDGGGTTWPRVSLVA